jgi:hypothetical protein
MLGVYTIVKPAADYGWTDGRALGLGALSLALLAGFIAREATARRPLIPLRIFRSRNVTGANLIQVLTVAGMFGMFFLGSLYLRRVLGYDALEIGLAFLPVTIAMGTPRSLPERLIMRSAQGKPCSSGWDWLPGLTPTARVPVHGSYVKDVLPTMILLALSWFPLPALMTIACPAPRA